MLTDITPVVLTYDEAPNIDRTLAALAWARRVVVLDSMSTDDTRERVARYHNAALFERPFDAHATQWQHAVEATGIDTEWVLCLDADWVMPAALRDELAALAPADDVVGYRVGFRYLVYGTPLRASLYPPVTALFRRRRGRFEQDGHTQRVAVSGRLGMLHARLAHDDRKPLSRWLWAQGRYARLEARLMRERPRAELSLSRRLRRALVIMPWLAPAHFLFLRGGLLDGPAGWLYAVQRAVFELLVVAEVLGTRWPEAGGEAPPGQRR